MVAYRSGFQPFARSVTHIWACAYPGKAAPEAVGAAAAAAPVPSFSGVRRHPSYYFVAGIDLGPEMDRLRGLRVFSEGPLAEVRPGLKVRRPQRRPQRLGFAVPGEWRLSVTAYPGISSGDVLETLLHELVHLHVGRQPGGHAWHGGAFKGTLAAAMAEAYGVAPARSTVHGAYAAAIERRRQTGNGQLELSLSA
jgi:hypothetical protein